MKAIYLVTLSFLILVSSCVPYVDVMDVSKVPKDERSLAYKIPVYMGEQTTPAASEFIDQIKATSCKHWMWEPAASTGNALEQLRIKALRIGAGAIVHVYCDKLGTNLGTNCWSSVTCSGDAVKLETK